MVLSEDEREQLGRVAREAWADYWRRDKPTYMESWDKMASADKEAYRVAAEAVATALLAGPALAVVPREVLARIAAYAAAALALEGAIDAHDLDAYDAAQTRRRAAFLALRAGDLAAVRAAPAGEGGG
jgi:hypothetical protein